MIPDPRALDSLTVTAHSMLLPQSRAASTLLMVFIGAPEAPEGICRAWGECKGLVGT